MKTYDLCNMHEGHVVSDVVLSIEKTWESIQLHILHNFVCAKLKFGL